MTTPCELIAQQLGLLFTCTPMSEYIRIETPFLYPDGDIIDVFSQERDDHRLLTDLGETQRWLKMQTAPPSENLQSNASFLRISASIMV
jgi:hypothetical protein